MPVGKMAIDAASSLDPAMRKLEGVKDVTTETRDFTAGDFSGKEITCKVMETNGTTCHSIHVHPVGWPSGLAGPTVGKKRG